MASDFENKIFNTTLANEGRSAYTPFMMRRTTEIKLDN
jgi:hypothetical protein